MNYKELIISPLDGEAVCGVNLEDEPSFQNFFFEAEGTPEKYDGQNTIPAEPPEWRDVKKAALGFTSQSKDLKLISVLAQAVLNTEGLVKFAELIAGLSELLAQEWEGVYPPLDEDDGDPMERISALGHLTDKSFIIDSIKDSPLVNSPMVGKITLRMIERVSTGEKKAEDLELSQIKGVFKDTDGEELSVIHQAAIASVGSLKKIADLFIAQAGHSYAVNFDAPIDALESVSKALEQHANIQTESPTPSDDDGSLNNEESASSASPTSSGSSPMPSNNQTLTLDGTLHSRADVEQCFNLIVEYYKTYEPSSPIPVLLNRAQKFVHMDFLDIIRDISPDSLTNIMHIGGIKEEDLNENIDTSSTTTTSSSSDDSW